MVPLSLFSIYCIGEGGHPQIHRNLSHTPYHTLYYDSQGAQTTTTSSQITTANTNSTQNAQSQHPPMNYCQHQPIVLYHLQVNTHAPPTSSDDTQPSVQYHTNEKQLTNPITNDDI